MRSLFMSITSYKPMPRQIASLAPRSFSALPHYQIPLPEFPAHDSQKYPPSEANPTIVLNLTA